MTAEVEGLEREALQARLLVLRMLRAAGSGHVGGALSAIDIVTALYFGAMMIDPARPEDSGRDRFLLSAGHKAMAQYAVLARRGFFPEELLDSYGALGSRLAGHPDMHKLPGVEANTGALGHGLAIACGMAIGLRMDGSGRGVYVILGDGELPEGSNWEAAAIASHHRLSNLTAFVDANQLQISGPTAEVMDMEPIAEKFAAFGWATHTIDGHDMQAVLDVLAESRWESEKPTAIVARTVKGKGIPAIEGTLGSHYWKPTGDELDAAEATLRGRLESVGQRVVSGR